MECGLGTSLEVPKPLAGLTFKVSMHGTFVHAEGNSDVYDAGITDDACGVSHL